MKRYESMLAVAFLFWEICFAADLYAYHVLISPTDDTWVYQYTPDTNYGSSEGMGSAIQYMSPRAYALLKFDLSSLSGLNIQSAVLHLYQYNGGGYGNGPTALLYNSNNSWAEGTVTWNNFVPGTQAFLVENSDGGSYRGWSEWAFSWGHNWGDIVSFIIGENSSGDQGHNWYTKEYTGTEGLVPYLVVTIPDNDIGVFRPNTGMWFLDRSGNGAWNDCATDKCINFGIQGDIPVTGDWNGDGTTKIGVFRPSIGWWFLDYNGNGQWDGCSTDRCYNFGISEDTPVTGDWNGDGKTEIGVYRKSIGWWFLDYNAEGTWSGCSTDRCYNFGISEDTPVTGDWNGDGKTEIGVFRPSIGMWFVDVNGDGTWSGCGADGCYNFGISVDLPVTGDWNDDGFTEIGVYRPSIGMWFLDYNGNDTWNDCTTDRCYQFGISVDVPVSGVF